MSVKIQGVPETTRENNLGKSTVALDYGLTTGAFFVPKGTTLTAEQLADMETTIKQGVTNDNPNLRWQYAGPFEGIDDKSEAPQQQTLGYGRKVYTYRGRIVYEFPYIDGGEAYHQNVMSYKGKQSKYDVLMHDENGVLKLKNGDSPTSIPLSQIFVYDTKPATINAVSDRRIALSFKDNADLNENAFYINTGVDIVSLMEGLGVQDVVLQNVTPAGAAPGVFHIAATTGDGTVDLVKLYGSALASATLWKPKNQQTAGAITITSAALNTAGNAVVFTLDTTDTDYPAAGNITFEMAAVSVLTAANISYFEVLIPLAVART